jgi:hypothetical protein
MNMTDRPPHASELVARYGEALAGSEWGAALARLTGINERTMSRIRAAAREGREYPAARGVLAALHEALTAVLDQLAPHARR